MSNWGKAPSSSNQQSLYQAVLAANAGITAPAPAPAATPGTSPATAGQPTSVSTAPATTVSTPSAMVTLAANMQQAIGTPTANPDQWNNAFQLVMGSPADLKYGFSFDAVYGPAAQRAPQQMSAMMFLQLAAAATGGNLPGLSGLGRIQRFPGSSIRSVGSMATVAHHPLPYVPSYAGFHGIGAFTKATGFERALLAGRPVRLLR